MCIVGTVLSHPLTLGIRRRQVGKGSSYEKATFLAKPLEDGAAPTPPN